MTVRLLAYGSKVGRGKLLEVGVASLKKRWQKFCKNKGLPLCLTIATIVRRRYAMTKRTLHEYAIMPRPSCADTLLIFFCGASWGIVLCAMFLSDFLIRSGIHVLPKH